MSSLIELLERSAEVLESTAIASHREHTSTPLSNHKNAACLMHYDEMKSLAKQLRKAAAYHKPNPLGGPAKVFDACADAIRAGDSIEHAMREFGLAWRKR